MGLQTELEGSRLQVSRLGLVELTSRAMMVALGAESCSNSNSFGPSSMLNEVTPVILPPGRFRLVTSPICTGSAMMVKTTGIVAVAAFAASAAGVDAVRQGLIE